ncbi:hypothetical protein DFH28DRAFT_1138495 [Melampsora americana]|nr:hypothetical protein DFH28DRAFT_1138495 [Melampsora americana]
MSSYYESDAQSYSEDLYEEGYVEGGLHDEDLQDKEFELLLDDEPFESKANQKPSQNSNVTSDSKSPTEVVRLTKKTFSLPIDRASYTTFTKEEATLDDEGYPILPNGNTVFVRQEGQKSPTNWGTFSFAYTTSGGGIKEGCNWRTVRFTCLGVIVCKSLQCNYLGSPHTSSARRKEWQSRPQKCPAARCNDYLCHIPCPDTLCRMDKHVPSGWGIIRHSGFHQHRWPCRSKPDKLSLDTFAKKVVANPDVRPLRHKVGRAPAGTQDIVTVTSIHPAFGNIHRTAYYRRKLLVEAVVIPKNKIPGAADGFILDMETWAE